MNLLRSYITTMSTRERMPLCGKATAFGFEYFVRRCEQEISRGILPSDFLTGFYTCGRNNVARWAIQFDRRPHKWGDVQLWLPNPCCSNCYGLLNKAGKMVIAAVRDGRIRRPPNPAHLMAADRSVATPFQAPIVAPAPVHALADAAAAAAPVHEEPPRERRDLEGIDVEGFPNDFLCPIMMLPMEDPVMCTDGHSYERSAIEEWFGRSRGVYKSPKTGLPLPSSALFPNIALKGAINEHIERLKAERASRLPTQE